MLVKSVFRNLSNISYGVFCEKLLTIVAILTIFDTSQDSENAQARCWSSPVDTQ